MNRLIVISLALLAGTGMASAQGVPAAQPTFSLSGTTGIVGFNLPSFDTGFFGHSDKSTLIGGMASGNFTATLGPTFGNWDSFVSLSMFGALASDTTSWDDSLTGAGTVTVTGLTAPGSASITTSTAGPDSSVTATNTNPQGGGSNDTVTATGGTTNVGFVSPAGTGNSFIAGGATNDGAGSRTAGAGIADTSGEIYQASGDLSGLSLTTSVKRSVIYVGGDISLGVGGPVSSNVGVQLYAGPSFRNLHETRTTTFTADMAEIAPSNVVIPNFSIIQNESLNNSYYGGALGGTIAIATSPGVVVTLGGEAALYDLVANWQGSDTGATCCGANITPAGASPSLSVASDGSSHHYGSTLAYAARANGAVTFDIGGNKSLTIGGNVEYLSKVANVSHGGQTTVTASADDGFKSGGGGGPTTSFSWGHMLDYGATVSLTGHF